MTAAMVRIDLKREFKSLYTARAGAVGEVVVPAFDFLMVDGQGDPNTSPAYGEAVEALCSLSYTLKFALKRERALDYVVMPLEGLWWADDPAAFVRGERAQWRWTAARPQPATQRSRPELLAWYRAASARLRVWCTASPGRGKATPAEQV